MLFSEKSAQQFADRTYLGRWVGLEKASWGCLIEVETWRVSRSQQGEGMASVKAQRQRRAWARWGQREGQQEWRSIGAVGDRGAHGGWRSRCGLMTSCLPRPEQEGRESELCCKSYVFKRSDLEKKTPHQPILVVQTIHGGRWKEWNQENAGETLPREERRWTFSWTKVVVVEMKKWIFNE